MVSVPDPLVEDLVELRRLLRRHAHPVRPGEITVAQVWLLYALGRDGPLSISELAARLGITASSATLACQRLERVGLVTRQRQPDDERIVRVALTPRGSEQVAAWQRRYREAVGELLAPLDQLERARLGQLLERIVAAAEAEGTPVAPEG